MTMTTSIKPLFSEIDGEIRMSLAATLLAVAGSGCRIPGETTAVGLVRDKVFIREVLSAARDGGFMQSEITETVLAQPLPSRRAFELAQAACACISSDAMAGVYMRVELAMDESK